MKELPDGPTETGMELFNIFTTNPFPFLKKWHDKYGDMFTVNLGTFNVEKYNASGAWVFVCNSDYIKILIKADSRIVPAGPANDIQFQQLMPEQSILLLDGPKYVERRKILSPSIQNNAKIRQLTPEICKVVLDEIEKFPINENFALTPVLRRIASEVMRNLIFGDIGKKDAACINTKLKEFGNLQFTHEEKEKIMSESSDHIRNIISEYKSCPHLAEKEKEKEKENIFEMLMNVHTKKQILDESDICGELLVLLLGGNETTGTTMTWIMSWILSQPNIRKTIQQELQQTFADHTPTADDFDKLHYLDAVIKESIRISPMLYTTSGRFLLEPFELGGYQLPAGTIIASCPNIIHNRPDYYTEPTAFMPERFINVNPDPSRWLHFGLGIRRCLGMAFALYEMKVVMATLLHNCDFECIDVSTEAEMQSLFFAPKGNVTVKLND